MKFSQWKRVKVEIIEKVKDKTRLVSVKVPTEEFKTIFKNEMESFREHVGRVKSQYKAVKDLKEKLLPGQVMLQMDFAEDCHFQNTDEVQNAYFGAANVTIFPVVAYYRPELSNDVLYKASQSFPTKKIMMPVQFMPFCKSFCRM